MNVVRTRWQSNGRTTEGNWKESTWWVCLVINFVICPPQSLCSHFLFLLQIFHTDWKDSPWKLLNILALVHGWLVSMREHRRYHQPTWYHKFCVLVPLLAECLQTVVGVKDIIVPLRDKFQAPVGLTADNSPTVAVPLQIVFLVSMGEYGSSLGATRVATKSNRHTLEQVSRSSWPFF